MRTHPLTRSRKIYERWIVEGDLVLETPTHLGNGDSDGVVDMPLLLDEVTGRALLPGTSLAGALRSYLREHRHGFGSRLTDALIESLFGAEKGNDAGSQSALIVEDALGEKPTVELRDGVRIDPATRTAKMDFENGTARGYKYDLELLEAGLTFPLRFELLLGSDAGPITQLLALALHGLACGEIALGLRKRRGFGECRVTRWRVQRYDLRQPADLIAWLTAEHPGESTAAVQPMVEGTEIAPLLNVSLEGVEDKRSLCSIHAECILDGSLLIRSGFGEQDRGPDAVHLHSARAGGRRVPVLSGTSLAGALRHRAERILDTLGNGAPASEMLDDLFGPAQITGDRQKAKASRLVVKETVITNPVDRVQNRIRIDRLTGSVHGTGLFNEQPVFGKEDTQVRVELLLRAPRASEIGLLLLLLKDLWTGDLPLGGGVSVGRGRLKGVRAEIKTPQDPPLSIAVDQAANRLAISDRAALERYVAALCAEVTRS